MKTDNPFDRKIAAQKRMPEHFRDAAIELTDTWCRNDYYDFVAELRR